ncbi:hypothetical protein, variant [Verruconis gallopava]|uniref:Uncharacterized protein n=1 Tax=Verruconis gallopava TaxID=253628 RepID=A0A0D2A0H6_9PEZI|nr:hypothetical protein, variant [Verruconis gallopava]KIV99824.1 hypothetical protein, variant [Verruconis gallopava]
MIGKLHNWRVEHHHQSNKKDWRNSGVGGLVSLEDLVIRKPKASSPSKAVKKKVPFLSLSLSKPSVTLKSLQSNEADTLDDHAPVASDVSLFSNIPASAGLTSVFPPSLSTSRPVSPTRPRTADPERASFARRRSKTLPMDGDTPQLSLDWTDKPLPLVVDFDASQSRKPSVSTDQSTSASISRPRTSQSMESPLNLQDSRKRSNSSASKGSKPAAYSLTPAISPAESRRPSLSGAEFQKIVQVAHTKSPSSASTSRPRSNSRVSITAASPAPAPTTSANTTMTSERPAPVPSPARSILEEVEGTLSATIRELQDLQGDWEHPTGGSNIRPMRTSSLMYKMPSAPEVPRSAPAIQEEFPVRSNSHDAATARAPREDTWPSSQAPSMPTTPRSASLPKTETPSLGRMQSIQIAYEKSKAKAHRLGVENDTLKQQMKFLRERFAEMGDLESEKQTLGVALKEARANIEASLAQLQASRANEEAIQNNLTNVARRLEEANVQKIDVLEHNSELQNEVASLKREMALMRKEMDELRQRPQMSELEDAQMKLSKAQEENKLLAEQAKAAEGRADLPAMVADLTFKLEDVRRTVAEKDKYIADLEAQTASLGEQLHIMREEQAKLSQSNDMLRSQSQKGNTSSKRLSQLQKQIEEIEKARHAAQVESERHLQLLKEQLRRNAVEVHKREHPASSLLEKKLNIEEAITEVRLKFERRKAREQAGEFSDESGDTATDPAVRIAQLEKEIEYHVKDIVLYKLDVKGYRKDLKRAKEKIAALTEAANAATTASTATVVAENTNHQSPSPPSQEHGRPDMSRESSSTSVPQLSPSTTRDPGAASSDNESLGPATPSITTALQVQLPVRHIVTAWSPGVSPRSTPTVENKTLISA